MQQRERATTWRKKRRAHFAATVVELAPLQARWNS